jgi:hypothetical protein
MRGGIIIDLGLLLLDLKCPQMRKTIITICLMEMFNLLTFFILILHKWSEQSQHTEVKGIKNRHKKFCLPVYGWGFMCLCVCLSGLKS